MKQKRTFVTLLLVIAILCLGIGYAAITGMPLTITGSAKAEVGNGQVDVEFVAGEDNIDKDTKVTAASVDTSDPTKASFTVEGLTATNETVTVTYTIKNNSTDIPATLQTPSIEWTNKEWFDVTAQYSSPNIAKKGTTGDTQTVTVSVKLLKAPVTTVDAAAASDSSITLTLQAEPASSAN